MPGPLRIWGADGRAPLDIDGVPLQSVQSLADKLPDGLVVVDGRQIIRFVNSRALQILQVRQEQLVDRPVRAALPLTDSEGRDWWELTDPWGGLRTRKGHREKLLWTSAGVEVLVTAEYARGGRGEPVSRVVMGLRDALARQRAEQDHAALISTLAHELRSPLTSVKGFSTTLLRRWDRFSDEQKRLLIETIQVDAERVTRLIADLLDVSRIDSGRLQLRLEWVDLQEIVQRHVRRLESLGVDLDRIRVQSDRGLPEVHADPDRIDQIVSNLLDNALKHGAGQVTVQIRAGTTSLDGRARVDQEREAVLVTVSDEGPGVAESVRGLIFSRFWHSPGQSNSGLGLYVVRALVEAHGGRIAVGSGVGGGAAFTFSLPAGDGEVDRDVDPLSAVGADLDVTPAGHSGPLPG